ncbi:type VI-A CRISPR-associated RNA-guided ribonuclease Cas13a [Insolitispirillum peregrinum]|uniref:CRISPR-associated endoribonuclease Cas13a n=1 Tax=Insolitispirillum peregrinum TaxID=80876 RepID=A0A1N7IRW0_9PROT|nr:type VI-A CRISPR-associated RNA-guided ribonuclease Cas13a [Insolitispirillum peregrinum]SIS39736.1 hypothetical protein SAMN05421779_101530 [Insolitispirillum peregrinum]
MRIIRPYGSSTVASPSPQDAQPLRSLQRQNGTFDVAEFSRRHPELVLAQWVAMLDKIIRKPAPGKNSTALPRPTAEQRRLRQQVGAALWAEMQRHTPVPPELKAVWDSKVHPYSKDNAPATAKTPSHRGRWYDRFGDPETSAATVAEGVRRHLLDSAQPFRANGGQPKGKGVIEHRALTIQNGTLLHHHQSEKAGPLPEDWSTYRADELVSTIGKDARWIKVAASLYQHYGRIFGPTTPISEAQTRPEFVLHTAVKAYYRRLFKERKLPAERLERLLPRTGEALRHAVTVQHGNRSLADAVRIGKILHYGWLQNGEPDPWPDDAALYSSRYWGSDGQTDIKHSEAVSRVWRRALTAAQRTLTSWLYPAGTDAGDILLIGQKPDSIDRNRLPLLYGDSTRHWTRSPGDVWLFLKQTLENLRNSSFHFKTLSAFTSHLDGTCESEPAEQQAAQALWQDDRQQDHQQVFLSLRALDATTYLPTGPLHRIVNAVQSTDATLPLPRFRRVVTRAANTRLKGFPVEPVNRRTMEDDPLLRCRYGVLKLLYERGFRAWLETRPSIASCLDQSLKRSTKAAQTINGKNSPQGVEILSRATKLLQAEGGGGHGIHDLFDRLYAATAREMRVQVGYHHDAEAARQQAEFIEDLKCEVVARAFCAYLKTLGIQGDTFRRQPEPLPTWPDLPDLPSSTIGTAQAALYSVLHLMPVEDVGSLLHQLRRWLVALQARGGEDGTAITATIPLLELYLNRHDAKFSGGGAGTGLRWDDWQVFFDCQATFDRVFPPGPALDSHRLPLRGLREVLRFGRVNDLAALIGQDKITAAEVDRWHTAEQTIAAQQQRREALHEQLSRKKGTDAEVDEYRALVTAIADHRHLTAHVTLSNVVRLHRLMTTVLGRLVDYGGLWERDLTFVTLYEAHRLGGLRNLLSESRVNKFLDGQTPAALSKKNNAEENGMISKVLGDKARRQIRNDFAHFNMLQQGKKTINLTDEINNARKLMAHDRKLKNAITRSVTTLLQQDGLDIVWTMDASHRLTDAKIDSRNAIHLHKTHNRANIREPLHGKSYCRWVAALFGATSTPSATKKSDKIR